MNRREGEMRALEENYEIQQRQSNVLAAGMVGWDAGKQTMSWLYVVSFLVYNFVKKIH